MRTAKLVGASRRRRAVTTIRHEKDAWPAPDLVDRNIVASRPNQFWVADITVVPTTNAALQWRTSESTISMTISTMIPISRSSARWLEASL